MSKSKSEDATPCVEILVLDEKSKNDKNKMQLRIVSWYGNNPVLEKRRVFLHEDDHGEISWRAGKCIGLSLEDVEIVKGRFDEVVKVMKDNEGKSNG